MSWLYSRALVEDCLEQKQLDLKQSALLNWTGIADAFSHSDKMSESLEVFSRFGMTFVPLTADRGAAELMLLVEGSLAKLSVQPQEEKITPLTYGLK